MYPNTFDAPFAEHVYHARYRRDGDENWSGTTKRVTNSVLGSLYSAPNAPKMVGRIHDLHDEWGDLMGYRRACPGGRYLYAAGTDFHQVNNCVLLGVEDSREGLAELSYRAEMALQSGAGIGVWYGNIRAAGSIIRRTGGEAGGPVAKMVQVNATGRSVISGGNRRSAIWGGLPWWHADIFAFITIKDWPEEVKLLKQQYFERGEDFPADCDYTNISVTLDDEFFQAYEGDESFTFTNGFEDAAPDGGTWKAWAHRVYWAAVSHMLQHGEPGFSIDVGDNRGEVLRNACTEITSYDDSDICNLGHLVLPRFESPKEFGKAVRVGASFLTAGSLYSEVPYEKVQAVREENRRLGLGVMGVHEFLMKKGVRYGTDNSDEVLYPYMVEYERALEYAHDFQEALGISLSKGATAIAPTGTTAIPMETTAGADPMFASGEVRKVKVASAHGDTYENHVVVDPTAARLVKEGVPVELIEDAHSMSLQPDRRLRQTAFLQQFVDHAISGTVNLPYVMEAEEDVQRFGDELMGYLPQLRGITVYPDGARSGQPRSPVDLAWALENEGTIFEASEEVCAAGVCGA